MSLQIFNTLTNNLVIYFDEINTPIVLDEHLKNDLKAGINVTPFFDLRKEDPLLANRPNKLKELDPEGKTYYRRVVSLPSTDATPAEKIFFQKILDKWCDTYLSHQGYNKKIAAFPPSKSPSLGDNRLTQPIKA